MSNACTTCLRHPPLVRWPPIRRHGRDPRRRKLSTHPAPAEAAMAFDGGPITSPSLPLCGTAPHPPPHRPRQPHGKGDPPRRPARQARPASIGTRTAPSSASLPNPPPQASAPINAWWPGRLPDGSPGSLFAVCNPKALPQDLAGLAITVWTRSGKSWDATVTDVVKRSRVRLLVRTRRLDQ